MNRLPSFRDSSGDTSRAAFSASSRPRLVAVVAAALLATACASQPDRYYTLAAPPSVSASSPSNSAAPAAPVFVELAPVALPERLARPQMVVRDNAAGAQVRILEQHRWSASFEKELRDALAAGVVARGGAIDVTKAARQNGQPVWRVAVQLRDFDAVENSRVDASFGWTLRRSDAPRALHCHWQGSEAAIGGIDSLALGAQRITSRAAEAIARQIASLQADPAAACLPAA